MELKEILTLTGDTTDISVLNKLAPFLENSNTENVAIDILNEISKIKDEDQVETFIKEQASIIKAITQFMGTMSMDRIKKIVSVAKFLAKNSNYQVDFQKFLKSV